MDLVYIGDHFYRESGTIMSSLYTEFGKRSDWGFVQRALAQGESVRIRPATRPELDQYEAALSRLKRDGGGMSEWQPIETAPKDGVKPLLISDGSFTYVGWWDDSLYGKEYPWIFWDHDGTNGLSEDDVTHWMPLPEPPK